MAHYTLPDAVEHLIEQELRYSVGGSTPLPAFIVEAKGTKLKDVQGKEYIDFLCAFSAVSQGHSHPEIVQAMKNQLDKAALVNTSAHTALWPPFAQRMCQTFGYDKIASTVSGSEAVDGACKIARKWAITKKGVPTDDVLILGVSDCFHGLTTGLWGLQDPSEKRRGTCYFVTAKLRGLIRSIAYGLDDKHLINYNPSTGQALRYGVIEDMKNCLSQHHQKVAAVIMECIRDCSKRGVRDLCTQYNVLFVADEVRMGICRTGKLLCSDYLGPNRRPDLITLGKSVTGGLYPASYILGKEEPMSLVGPRELMSTFALSPLAIVATEAAIEVAHKENLAAKASMIGTIFTERSKAWKKYPFVDFSTARGGSFGIWFKAGHEWLCRRLGALCMHNGLLVFPKDLYLRMSVALNMTTQDLSAGLDILDCCLDQCFMCGPVAGEVWREKL